MTEVRCLLEKRSVLGEGPIWRPRENSLYWIDLKAPAIYCFDVITRQNRQVPAALGKTIGGMVFARDGRMIVVDAEGVHVLNTSGHRNLLVNPESDQVGNAFNDAKCDPKGRLWSGTADIGETRQSGSLYVIEGQGRTTGRVRRIDSGIICSNGPAFAPDGRRAYFTDSFAQEIYCYDVDLDTGLIGERKSFFRCAPEAGYPDGMTVDSEGYLWCCNWDGWSVTRYTQNGEIDRVLKVPVPRPTSVCFGGPRMDQLFITSASDGLSADQLREAPLSGSLFVCEPGVKGLLDAEFNG
jgi:sugar lactone lactonase YvrE